jgi:hypothetical protein
MKRFILGSAIVMALALVTTVYAREPLVVKSKPDKATVTVGDQIRYKVTAAYEPGVTITEWKDESAPGVKILKKEKTYFTESQRKTRQEITYVLTFFDVGDHDLPIIHIAYVTSKGEKGKVESGSPKIKVKSVLGNITPQTDIRDVKSLAQIEAQYQKYLRIAVWVIIGIFFVLLVIGISLFFKKKFSSVHYLLKPYEEAVSRLDHLGRMPLKNDEAYKIYYRELVNTIRRFLERSFGLTAGKLTTRELELRIRDLKLQSELENMICSFLEVCDIVKFADVTPLPDETLRDLKQARLIIDGLNQLAA